ncbi:MAG TPA: helix-turn-helix transcriptional regulator [Ktedonobacterales bacterium]|nr:helix-turn-helix transcriptional regulator [Ktedonobacterales bacterium]
MDESARRQALADFLRSRREHLQAADVGLPARPRRRTPGLRREEVAELAAVGVSWYTLLEQGRDVHPSRGVLANIARALHLTPAEEQHLYFLAQQEPTSVIAEEADQITPAVQRVVEALDPHPAFAIGRRWDALAWNQAARLVFHFDDPCPPHAHNVIWRFFAGEAQLHDPEWVRLAQSYAAAFRMAYVRYPADPAFQALLADLQRVSEHFCRWWEQQQVHEMPDGTRMLIDPQLGELAFDHLTFLTPVAPDVHVKVFVALPETRLKLQRLLARSA